MHKANLLLVVQKKELLLSYNVLLKQYVENISEIVLEGCGDIFQLDTNKYDIILIDIINKRYLDCLSGIRIGKAKIILVTTYNFGMLTNSTGFVDAINLVLSKPLDVDKLVRYIQNESYIIQRRNILETKNHILVKVVDLHPSRIGVYDKIGILLYANHNYLNANKLKISDIDKVNFSDVSECNIGFNNILEQLEISRSFTVQREEGKTWYESVFYIVDNQFVIHICSDITIQKQKEIQLEQSAVFFENSNEGIVITDSKGIIRSVNKSFSKITGYTKDEVIGKTPAILNSGIHDKLFYDNMWSSLVNNNSWQGEIWNKRKNGEIYPEWLSIAKAINPKYNEEFYIAIFTDISTLKDADKKLHYYANHDILTGLANRVQFEAYLKNALANAKRNNTKLALFFVDLDKFKEINDTFGHDVGDIMLQTVGKRIEHTLREDDFVARIGGDEFVLVLKDVKSEQDMINIAEKLNNTIKEPIKIDNQVFFMTLSIGIAIYPEHGKEAADLIKNADAAMYVVKENGRNSCLLYQKEMTDKVSQKLNTQNQLKVAIEQDQFEMYYQAVVDLTTDTIVGAEALVRWNHLQKGVLSPAAFIGYIDDSSMSLDFGKLVIKKVLSDVHLINSMTQNPNFVISINISPKHFFEEKFVKYMVEVCKDFCVNPSQIEIELLETSIMSNHIIAQHKFDILKKEGFHIAIDDFGTGYSSLSYLKNFKVDKLKIDQSFVRDFLSDNNDKSIVEAIIKLANTFEMSVQAEGVETLEHQKLLKELNCDLAQGYFYNKPSQINDFINLVSSWK